MSEEQAIDVSERGAPLDGKAQHSNKRLFMSLSVYRCPAQQGREASIKQLETNLARHKIPSVIYKDISEAHSVALLLWSEDPKGIIDANTQLFEDSVLRALEPRNEMNMLGRTYSSGFEPDLQHFLIDRPIATALNKDWPWAIWYPLRRHGSFEKLDSKEQRMILGEHAHIGKAYAAQDLAHDIRLACHGLDTNDNEFVIGLTAKELYPLSHLVQRMRKTRQTSEFIQQMGPFFVGHACWQQG